MKHAVKSAIAGFALTFIGLQTAFAAGQTIRLAHENAAGGLTDLVANDFASRVNAKTNGAVTIKVFPAGQLGGGQGLTDQVNNGLVDMELSGTVFLNNYWQPASVTSLPYLFRDWRHLDRAFAGDFGKMLKEGISANSNINILGMFNEGFRIMFFRKDPIVAVSGMSGLKMRAPESTVWIRMYQLLGSAPTTVNWADVYSAMQTGLVDGMDAPPKPIVDSKYYEVLGAGVRTRHMVSVRTLEINQQVFDKLSPENQKAIQEAALESAAYGQKLAEGAEQDAYKVLQDKGVKIIDAEDLDAWSAAMKPLWQEFVAKYPQMQGLIDAILKAK